MSQKNSVLFGVSCINIYIFFSFSKRNGRNKKKVRKGEKKKRRMLRETFEKTLKKMFSNNVKGFSKKIKAPGSTSPIAEEWIGNLLSNRKKKLLIELLSFI